MVTEARLVHPENVLLPIEVTELGMVTEARLVQFRNASLPIEMTELGMDTEVRPTRPGHSLLGTFLTLSPKTNVVILVSK